MSLPHSRQWYRNTRQHALLEYTSLKHHCPEGIYISLKPGSPAQWSGVLFVRKGPYAPAILRFAVAFPPNYPTLPPLISFVSDIFHPLVTPLTTYTYSTGSLSSETVSATDDERLPPGGFSLRHGFPHWFRRAEKSAASPTVSSRNVSGSHNGYGQNENDAPQYPAPGVPSSRLSPLPALSPSTSPSTSTPEHADAGTQRVGIVDVLDYMKSAFDEDITMDVLPLEAAGNPGAWNAWRAYRKSVKKASDLSKLDATNDPFTQPSLSDLADKPLLNKAKLPSEWNWDGVWRERVQKGIDASISNSVLFGATGGGEELIQFVGLDDEFIQVIKEQALTDIPKFN